MQRDPVLEAFGKCEDYSPESFIVMSKITGTSDLNKEQASEFLEWLYAFGAEIGVKFDE